MRFPVDTGSLRCRVATPPRPENDFESGRQRMRDGVPVWLVDLLVMDGTEADTVRVRVVAPAAPAVQPDDLVTVSGLSVLHWSMDGRSGLSFLAEGITKASGK